MANGIEGKKGEKRKSVEKKELLRQIVSQTPKFYWLTSAVAAATVVEAAKQSLPHAASRSLTQRASTGLSACLL